MNIKTKRRRDAITRLNNYHFIRLEAEFGRELAEEIRPSLDAALGNIACCAAIVMTHDRDVRDLFLFFSQMLSDANNVMENLAHQE